MAEKQMRHFINSFIKKGLMNMYGLDYAVMDYIEGEEGSEAKSTEELIKSAIGEEIWLHFQGLCEDGEFDPEDGFSDDMVFKEMDKFVWWMGHDGSSIYWDDKVRKEKLGSLDSEKLIATERGIAQSIQSRHNFAVSSASLRMVEKIAEYAAVTTISVKVSSLDEIKGKQLIHMKRAYGSEYFDYEYEWSELIVNHPGKTFLVLFEISDATDSTLISELASVIDTHTIGDHVCPNFFAGLIYDGDVKKMPAAIATLYFQTV